MQAGQLYSVASSAARDFRGAIAHGAASGITNLPLPKALFQRSRIRSIAIVGIQDIKWEVDFFWSENGYQATPDPDCFLGRYVFASAPIQIAAAGLYRNVVSGLDMPLVDLDAAIAAPQFLHVVLANVDAATDKMAGDDGAVKLIVWAEPTLEG